MGRRNAGLRWTGSLLAGLCTSAGSLLRGLAAALSLGTAVPFWSRLARRTLLPLRPVFAGGTLRTLSTGGNGCERDAAAGFVDLDHPDLEDVSDADHLVRVFDKPVRQAANVDKAAVGEAD